MKIFRILRVGAIIALILFCLLGLNWRAGISDQGIAAYQAKRRNLSVSIEEEGRIIKVEGMPAPGQPIAPCSATLVFDVAPAEIKK
jgi:hypothetical protein